MIQKYFLPVAAISIFLVLCVSSTETAQQRYSNISLGSSLIPITNSSWLSGSGLFAFGFYHEANGFAVGIFLPGNRQKKTVVWTANRDDPPVSTNSSLVFTRDGLVLQLTQGQGRNITNSSQPASSASMLDSGNFVLYNANHEIIWQSFEHPTDTVVPGQRLVAGQQLFSSVSETNHSTGKFTLNMQHDGNLVQYPVNALTAKNAYWASDTVGQGDNVTLNLHSDAHLYLLNASGFTIRSLTNGGYPMQEKFYLMKIDVDGILRLYSHSLDQSGNRSVIWWSSNDSCDPKGICGLNSYCNTRDQEPVCSCLPGFDFVNRSQNSDCDILFIAESCRNKSGSSYKYALHELYSVVWEDDSYSVSSAISAENCKEACLGDCYCEAALFRAGECRKQKLPLRFGRRLLTDRTIAFVKVGESATTSAVQKESKKNLRMQILVISVSFIVILIIVLGVSGVLIYRYRVRANKKIGDHGNVRLIEDVAPRSFTYEELENMTNGFAHEVGRGAFGAVYKGTISNGERTIAVKRLFVLTEGEREFQTEIRVIGITHHRNLVRLVGYCHEGSNRLLVYEYMTNGSLADVLFAAEKQLNWDERMRIALNITKGILYLHEECETQIIHCDIKPQNILMDENWCAKVSDFGVAKLLKPNQTKTSTMIRGTRGYVAPEWHRKLPVTVKVDVYSFGVMLLEIICRRKNIDNDLPDREAVLEEWVYNCFEAGETSKLVGDEEVDIQKLERTIKIGLWCIQDEPSLRPSMKKVLLMLEGTVDIPNPPNPTSFLSSI